MQITQIQLPNCILFLATDVSDVPFEDRNLHRDRVVLCPRCARTHRLRIAQDTRCQNEWTYLCERCTQLTTIAADRDKEKKGAVSSE